MDIYKTEKIRFYKNKGDKFPERTIHLVDREMGISIVESDYHKWLKPESIWLDYSIFIFRYTKLQDNWVEIIVNNDLMKKMWIQKNENLKINTWETFLVNNTTAIVPSVSTEIKFEQSDSSKTIRKSTTEDCFEAMEIKDQWIKIKTNEKLDCNEHPVPIESGWIKWNRDNKLIIEYFMTC